MYTRHYHITLCTCRIIFPTYLLYCVQSSYAISILCMLYLSLNLHMLCVQIRKGILDVHMYITIQYIVYGRACLPFLTCMNDYGHTFTKISLIQYICKHFFWDTDTLLIILRIIYFMREYFPLCLLLYYVYTP